MSISVFNTLTKKKEELLPRKSGEIGMYVCGPTVYNYIHIGNARTFLNFDLIRRYLVWRGYRVTFVQNITDIDDKIINRAAEERISASEVARKYEAAFHENMAALGVEPPTYAPRATETIEEMIELVERLLSKRLAYVVDGDVYFGVRRFPAYGKLSGRSLDDMRAGERVEVDERKEDPMDFALWKSAKPGEPSWPSPWGEGRPGWHLECSAMSLKYLGEGFDIHGGAHDLIFPHHENEIAQSEGALGENSFARYWLHGGLLNIDKEKMSKSLGNFLLLNEALKKWPPAVIRMFMVGTHYRNPLDFTEAGLDDAAGSLERLRTFVQRVGFAAGTTDGGGSDKDGVIEDRLERARSDFTEAMDDDFNSAAALAAIFTLLKEVNAQIENTELLPSRNVLERVKAVVTELMMVLGIDVAASIQEVELEKNALMELARELGVESVPDEPGAVVEVLLARRDAARADKDWSAADRIRAALADMGVEIEDTPSGSRWRVAARG